MTDLAPIDQRIAAWDERLRRIDESLLALEGDATYQMLSGSSGTPAPLEGITKERVRPALDAMLRLFEQRQKVTDVLDRAKEIRASISPYSLWGTEEKLQEIDALLSGPSVVMTLELTPLAERRLLDVAARDVAMAPEQLLHAMVSAFDVARDAVVAVRNAWSKLEPAIDEVDRDLAILKKRAERAGGAIPSELLGELALIERELSALRRAIAFDPLGASGTLTAAFRPRFVALREHLDEAIGARARVEAALADATAMRAEIDVARAAAAEAIADIAREYPASLQAPRRHAVDAAELAELDGWYRKLESTVAAGNFHRAEIGVARYRETATAYLDAERGIVKARDALSGKRSELAGRLSARRAQLASLAARGVVVPDDLERRGREAEAALGKRPFAIDAATPLVDAFEAAVVALARR